MNKLNKLIGNRILKANADITTIIPVNSGGEAKIEIPISLVFVDYTLNIYNSFIIKGVTDASLSTLEDLVVQACAETDTEIILCLDKSVELIVDMSDNGYNGPEALSLYGPDNLFVVWD